MQEYTDLFVWAFSASFDVLAFLFKCIVFVIAIILPFALAIAGVIAAIMIIAVIAQLIYDTIKLFRRKS